MKIDNSRNGNGTISSHLEFKYIGTYNTKGTYLPQKDDYYYVYNFDQSMSDYYDVLRFAKTLELDTSKENTITFMRFDKALPDTIGYSRNNYLLGGQFNDYRILNFGYRTKMKKYEVVYFKMGNVFKAEYFDKFE
ncbi:MAG TPA: hypothetical protein VE978_19415 [Chitinophagales bacterium]|nr:hypothetical protein [Chitinophagales bacterium]